VSSELGEAAIVLEDGTQLGKWKEYSIDSDFLTPTDGWSFSFGTEVEWTQVKGLLVPDSKIQITIDGVPQLTGYIDRVRASADDSGGVTIHVEGRDILKQLVKGNIHPDTRIKNRTLQDLVESALKQLYGDNAPTLVTDNDSNRQIITGAKARHKHKKARKLTSELQWCQAHANEGAFDFCARNLRRFGLWMWAAADGTVVISSPNYDQPSSYLISRRRGDTVAEVQSASWSYDKTNVPSHVIIRGRSSQKEFAKKTIGATVKDPTSTVDCPIILLHDQADTNEQAYNYAVQELYRHKQDEIVYECTLTGHRCLHTQLVYNVDTIAHVEDDYLGVSDDFYVARRTFHKSATGGTTTTLKLVPLYSIRFSDADAP
jgi:prophage tail gpP-like protein